jgi:hypothetical protein
MKIALTLSALALTALPAMAYSGCGADKVKQETASTCAPGSTFDPATQSCTVTPSS